jgi:hypothetical protein
VNSEQFDRLARHLATAKIPRRQIFKALLAGFAGALLAGPRSIFERQLSTMFGSSRALAATLQCGATRGDRAAVATVLFNAATSCPCDTAPSHADYVTCVSNLAASAVQDGSLPRQCMRTVLRAARHSTCGRPGAVTCCEISAEGDPSCHIRSSAGKCKPRKGGSATVGTSTTCYDACLPACEQLTFTDAEIATAAQTAVEGVADPWGVNLGVVIDRAVAELGCRVTAPPTPSPSSAQVAPDSTVPGFCDTHFCRNVLYCGQGNSASKPGRFFPPVTDCLNNACFDHDLCYMHSCISAECIFSQQTAGCDLGLFNSCVDDRCASSFMDRLTCAVAVGIEGLHILHPPPACADAPCTGCLTCDSSSGECVGEGVPCGRTCCQPGFSCCGDEVCCDNAAFPVCCIAPGGVGHVCQPNGYMCCPGPGFGACGGEGFVCCGSICCGPGSSCCRKGPGNLALCCPDDLICCPGPDEGPGWCCFRGNSCGAPPDYCV